MNIGRQMNECKCGNCADCTIVSLKSQLQAANAKVERMEKVVDEARKLCKGYKFEWRVAGGLYGHPMQDIAKIDLLDGISNALADLERGP